MGNALTSLGSIGSLAALLCGGCAVGGVGLIATEVTHGDGAWVADVYTLGGDLRTRGDDPGFSFGAQRRSYVFPSDRDAAPEPGWYYFETPLPDDDAAAIDARTVGLDVRAAAPEVSAGLGLSAFTLLARIPHGRSVAMQISYAPDDPAQTHLRYCEGAGLCDLIE